MTIAIDSNVLDGYFRGQDERADQARTALQEAAQRSGLIISAPVYAEVAAKPGIIPALLDDFLRDADIGIAWQMDEAVWRLTALAYRGYAERRRAQPGDAGPRRVLADFIIGAHASLHATALMTFDARVYPAAFPGLTIIRPDVS